MTIEPPGGVTLNAPNTLACPMARGIGRTARTGATSSVQPHPLPELELAGGPPQYDAHPLVATAGERVRLWVLAAGPNAALAFHVVETRFDTAWSEGGYRVHHDRSTDGLTRGATGARVLSLLPAEGGFVEFVPREPGRYAFVNHQVSLAEKGAHRILDVTG